MIVVRWAQRLNESRELVRLDDIERNGVAVEEFRKLLVQLESSRFAALVVVGNAEYLQQVGLVRNACRSSTSRATIVRNQLRSDCNGI